MNRGILREWRSPPVPAAGFAGLVLVALSFAMIIVAAVLVYRAGGLQLSPITFVMGGYLSLPFELTTFVPGPKDGPVPIPTL